MPLFNYSKWLPRIAKKLILARFVLYISVPIWLLAGVCYVALSNPEQWNTSEPDLPGSVAEQAVVIAVMLTVMLPLFLLGMGVSILISTKSIKVSPYAAIPLMKPMINALRIEKNMSLTKAQTVSYYMFCAAMVITIYLLGWIQTPS